MEDSYKLYELFTKQAFTIPLWQVMLLAVVSSICLTRKMQKTGLIITYFFLLYWGFVFNRPYFSEHLGGVSLGYILYALFGLAMLTVLFISFFTKDTDT